MCMIFQFNPLYFLSLLMLERNTTLVFLLLCGGPKQGRLHGKGVFIIYVKGVAGNIRGWAGLVTFMLL